MISSELLSFLIHWGPTLIFVFCLTIAFLFGLWRGLRKSVILLIQAAAVFGILLIIYFIVVNQPSTDGALFGFISKIIGEGKIQQTLGVSQENQTFADCFIEFLPKQVSFNEGVALVLKDNGMYLASLADMAVRIVIAIVFGIFYLIGIFLLYIIYLLFYPQRRYEKKRKKEYLENQQKELAEIKAKEEENARLKEQEAASLEQAILEEESMEEEPLEESTGSDMILEGSNDEDTELLDEAVDASDEMIDEEAIDEQMLNDENLESIESADATDDEPYVEEETHVAVTDNVTPAIQPKYQAPYEYKKRRLFGALVGSLRNVWSALIFFSLIGGLLFLLTGGSGEGSYEDIDFEDEQVNMAYNAYKEIETYGTTGIFKVLNTFKDSTNTPYYLFAADLIFQGGLKDEERGINQNVYLRRELASYTRFARETFDLVLKYGKDEIKNVIHNPNSNDSNQMMDAIMSVMAKDEFGTEFQVLIDNFEESTYFTNLSYSLLTSFVNHIDKFGLEDSLGEQTLSLIQVLFKKGYLAKEIPYENNLKTSGSTSNFDYIKPEMIFNKTNAKVLTNIVFDVAKVSTKNKQSNHTLTALNSEEEKSQFSTETLIDMVGAILPHIKEFTLFNEENKTAVVGVLKRVYEFSLNTYVKDFFEGQGFTIEAADPNVNPYEKASYTNVDFVEEIKNTIATFGDIVDLYSNAYVEDASVIDMAFNVFDSTNPNHAKAEEAFENVKDKVSNSFLLGDLLGSVYGKAIIASLFSTFTTTLELPTLEYRNKKDASGNVVYGEFHHLLSALEALCRNQDNKQLINDLSSINEDNAFDIIEKLCDALESPDTKGVKVLNHIIASTVFKAVFSDVLMNKEFGSFKIYIDDSLLEVKDGQKTKIIQEAHLEEFFHQGKNLVSVLKDVKDSPASEMMKAVMSEKIYNTLDSKIIEGTITNYLATNINIDMVVIPNEVKNMEKPISTNEYQSEARKIVGLYQVEAFDVETLTKEYENSTKQMEAIVRMLKALTDADYNKVLNSKILYYSMSNYVITHSTGFIDDMDILVPNTVKDPIENEVIEQAIQKEELKNTFRAIAKIVPETGEMGDILPSFRGLNDADYDTIFASKTLHYTISNYLETKSDVISSDITLIIPNETKLDTDTADQTVLAKYIKALDIKQLIQSALIILPEEGEISDIKDELRRIDKNDQMDDVLVSNILHYTISNYLATHTDMISSDVTLVIPNLIQDVKTAEVLDKVIQKTEIKRLIHSAMIILPEDNSNVEDIMDEFRKVEKAGKMDEVFLSEILHFTVSNYLKTHSDVISSDVALIIPNDAQTPTPEEVDPKVITTPEIKDLLHSALMILPEEGSMDDIMKEFRRIEKDGKLDEVFESIILHYTVSNYLKTHSDVISSDVSLVIPYGIQDTKTDDAVDKVIQLPEVKKSLHSALLVLPEEGSMDDIMKEFRRIETAGKLDEVFESEIMHFTVSNYLKTHNDVVSDDVDLVIPNVSQEDTPTEIVDKVVYTEELKKLIHGALMIIPESGSIDNILNILETKTEAEYDEIFESEVMHFTFSGYLMDNRVDFLGDGGDLIIPLAACTEPVGEVVARLVTKAELTRFLLDATSILPEDKNNIDIGLVMNQLIKDEQLLKGLILSASMTNMMVNSSSIGDSMKDSLKIPNALKDKATLAELDLMTTDSDWYKENMNFMKALNALIGEDLNDSFTVLSTGLSNKVYDNFSKLNEGTGETKLDVAYHSYIMVNTIASRIDELDAMSDAGKASIKMTFSITDMTTVLSGIYKKEEISSLVDLVNFLSLDLKDTAVMNTALNKSSLQKFNEPAVDYGYSGTYLNYFYLHDVTGLILTHGLDGKLDIPNDALKTGKIYIMESEAKALIDALDPLGLDLNSFSFDPNTLSITAIKNCIFNTDKSTKSIILFQRTSDEVLSHITSLIVMASDYDSGKNRLESVALYDFFEAALVMGVANIGDDPNIEHFQMNKTDEQFEVMATSSIMRSTLIQYLSIEFNSTPADTVIEYNNAYVIKDFDKDGASRATLTFAEAYNLFRSIRILSDGTGEVSNISLDVALIKALSDSDKDIVLDTQLIKYHVSKSILDAPYIGYETVYPTDTVDKYTIIHVQTLDETTDVKILTREQIKKWINTYA